MFATFHNQSLLFFESAFKSCWDMGYIKIYALKNLIWSFLTRKIPQNRCICSVIKKMDPLYIFCIYNYALFDMEILEI